MSKKVAAIICAAGPGSRFGGKRKKQFVEVAGRAVFMRSLELFANRDDVKQVLLGISKEDEETLKVNWGAKLSFFGVKVFFGGAERFETIVNAMDLIKEEIDLVAVHDACRCCATEKLVTDVIAKAAETGAAIPAAPVTATIKQVQDGAIVRTVDRAGLFEAQTPRSSTWPCSREPMPTWQTSIRRLSRTTPFSWRRSGTRSPSWNRMRRTSRSRVRATCPSRRRSSNRSPNRSPRVLWGPSTRPSGDGLVAHDVQRERFFGFSS